MKKSVVDILAKTQSSLLPFFNFRANSQKRLRMLPTLLLAMTCLGAIRSLAAENTVTTPLGTLEISADGQVALSSPEKFRMELELGYFRTGWVKRSQAKAKMDDLNQKEGTWTFSGALTEAPGDITFTESVTVKDGKIVLYYRVVVPAGMEFAGNSSGPFVSFILPDAFFADGVLSVGDGRITLPAHNKWSSGMGMGIPNCQTYAEFDRSVSVSVWKDARKKGSDVRLAIPRKTAKGAEGPAEYELGITLRVSSAAPVAKGKPKVLDVEDKATCYSRVLDVPLYPGVSYDYPKQILATVREKKEIQKNLATVEKWFAAHAALLEAADGLEERRIFSRFAKLPTTTADFDQMFTVACEQLNAGDTEATQQSVTAMTAALNELDAKVKREHGTGFLTGEAYNPNAWLRVYRYQGYVLLTDPMAPREPSPFSILWGVPGSKSVAYDFDLTTPGDTAATYTRSASSTRATWRSPEGATYTFSVMTPLISIDHAKTLNISKLPSELNFVAWMGADGQIAKATKDTAGAIAIPERAMANNWLWLKGDKLSVLLFPGSVPRTIQSIKERVVFDFGDASFVSLLPLAPDSTETAVLEAAKFWSRVAVATPEDVVETFSGKSVVHNYLYRMRKDAWNTAPLKIAPIPPLTVLAGDGDWKRAPAVTVAGAFRYVDGDRVAIPLPKQPDSVLWGVNEYVTALKPEKVDAFAKTGMGWIRVLFGQRKWATPDEPYELLPAVLESMRKAGIKALVDPHHFGFVVKSWEKGIPEDLESRQPFFDMWNRLAKICIEYPDVVVGYDLYNELTVRKEDWAPWKKLAEQTIRGIRAIDTKTPIYISGVDMSNPSGYIFAEPMDGDNLIYSFHYYAPHAFSHQKILTTSTWEPYVFYPGWIPRIDWAKRRVYGEGSFLWWDRWTIQAAMAPVLEFSARHGVAIHCGEFAPIGYSQHVASEASASWTVDVMDVLSQNGISWHLWNQGFGLTIKPVAREVNARWERAK